MTVNDQEPRYQLLDSNGNKVGTVYWDGSNVAIQEGSNQNEVTLASDGTFTTPALDADLINNVHYIDSSASDWGAAVNDALTDMSDGDALVTPPGKYNHATAATIDKNVWLIGHGKPKGQTGQYPVEIDRGSSDVPFISGGDGFFIGLTGFRFLGDDTGTASAVETNGPTYARWVDGIDLGTGSVFSVTPGANDSNINGTDLCMVGGRQVQNVVYTESGTNSNNVTAHVATAFNVRNAAIDYGGGSASQLYVNQVEGGTNNPVAGVIIRGSRNLAYVTRVEMSEPGIQFEESTNLGVILYNVLGDDFVYNNANNRGINIGTAANRFVFGAGNGGSGYKFDARLDMGDNSGLHWGDGPDFKARYNTTDDRLNIQSITSGDGVALGPNGGMGRPVTENLANVTPDFDGQTLRDDGTNDAQAGQPYWADTSAGVWRSYADPTTTVTY